MSGERVVIGSEEWCGLPALGLPAIKARVDSGAKTSALHAFNIETFEEGGARQVRFDIHPVQGNRRVVQSCCAPLVARRSVRSSSGDKERRPVIRTPLELGGQTWDIEITLSNRDSMGYRMLLGREAMAGRALIDPDTALVLGDRDEGAVCRYYHEVAPGRDALDIVVLASNPDLYSNQRLMEAGEERGHRMRFVNIRQCYMNICADQPAIHYRGEKNLGSVDAVIPRIRPSMTFYGCAVVRQFQSMGAACLNDSVAIARARDKLRCLQMLAANGVPMPATGFANSPSDTADIIRVVGGAPVVIKLLEGAQGRGVVLAETGKAAESVINAFKSLHANILVQQFVREADGRDLRCFVVDGKVVGTMERVAAPGEFRANLHLGGQAQAVRATPEERKIALAAAKVLGLKVAGVDIIRSRVGPLVLEVNASPGLQGIEAVTGKDVAGLMIEAAERGARKKRPPADAVCAIPPPR
jgi:ribosomal protein S6--L-glutamate ligase